MTRRRILGALAGPTLAILLGLLAGLILLAIANFGGGFGGPAVDRSGRVEIAVNGIEHRMSRDVLLPNHGWALQVLHPGVLAEETRAGLDLQLRSERTGATLQIEELVDVQDGISTLLIRESLGISEGLLSVRARLSLTNGQVLEDSRRIRIRRWFGGKSIGSRQVIHFDFSVDHDGDSKPDFLEDLEYLGLTSPEHPELAREVARRIEERALSRVERAYDATNDPNLTGLERDGVHVLFRQTKDPAALVTRICVGGQNPTQEDSVGYVHFDRRNEDKRSTECGGDPFAGIFPGELEVYRDAPLYVEVMSPFQTSHGGRPIGTDPEDSISRLEDGDDARSLATARLIAVIGDVLGTIMAHEAGHTLGLVAAGKPGAGLFGGAEGDVYKHNLDADGERESTPWLMNVGKALTFEELAGESEAGELAFRPLNYAYLRDRIVLADPR